jgi:hypothetical protein
MAVAESRLSHRQRLSARAASARRTRRLVVPLEPDGDAAWRDHAHDPSHKLIAAAFDGDLVVELMRLAGRDDRFDLVRLVELELPPKTA